MSPDEKLSYMANQIGKFFAPQGEERAVRQIADHLKKFWTPVMREAIIAQWRAGTARLDPLAQRAVAQLAGEGGDTKPASAAVP